jgi:hypothetical protein
LKPNTDTAEAVQLRDEADEQLSRAMLSEDDPAVLAEFALLEAACAAELAASSAHPAVGVQLPAASVRDSSALVSELPAAPSHPVNIATDLAVNIAAPGPVRKSDAPVVLLS